MTTKDQLIKLKHVKNEDIFEALNEHVFGLTSKRVGAAARAINNILNQTDLLKAVMTNIVNVSATSSTTDWDKHMSDYFESISIDVPKTGKNWNIGFHFSLDNSSTRANIELLKKEMALKNVQLVNIDFKPSVAGKDNKDPNAESKAVPRSAEEKEEAIITNNNKIQEYIDSIRESDIAEYIMANIPVNLRYKYGTPINAIDYIEYIYCMGHKAVSNTLLDVNKSRDIMFYIHDESEIKKIKNAKHKASTSALQRYLNIIGDRQAIDAVEDALYLCMPEKHTIFLLLDSTEKERMLKDYVESNPEEFLDKTRPEDAKKAKLKAMINRLIQYGILKRVPGTDVYVDGFDNTQVKANSYEELITFFSNDRNKVSIQEYELRLKTILNK